MSEQGDPGENTSTPKDGSRSERERQRAEALRANLLRRKAQARNRMEIEDTVPAKPGGSA